MGTSLINWILKHSLIVLIVTGVITAGALYFLPKITFDNSVDAFFDKESGDYIAFQQWKEQFGSDDLIVVAFSDRDTIFTSGNLTLISQLTQQFENVQYVDKVTSLTSINDIIGSDNDFIVRKFVEEIPTEPATLQELRQRAVSNPLYLKNVISSDGKTTALIIELERRPQARDIYKKEAVENITGILKRDFPRGRDYYISGPTAVEYYYARYMQDDFRTFMPVVFAIIILLLIVSFRGLVGFLLPLSVVILSLIWTMAFLYLCGYSINNVTTVIPPIMLSITLLEGIHFVWELIEKKKTEPERADTELIADTMKHLFVPCFLTNITTVIGFFSLLIITVPPIKQLGWVSGIGILFAFIITFTYLPAVIKQFQLVKYIPIPRKEDPLEGPLQGFLYQLTVFSDRFKYPILIVTAVVMVICAWQTFRIKTETSVVEYFRKDSSIYRATSFVENNLSGVHFLNISIRCGETDGFKDPAALTKIAALQEFLAGLPEVDKTTSVVDYLKEINKSFHNEDPGFYAVPGSRNLIAQYLLLYGAKDLQDYVNSEWDWATVRIRLKEHSTTKLEKVIGKMEDYLSRNFQSPFRTEIVGQTRLEVNSNEAVTSGQIQSLSLAMILIFGMMFIDFKSLSLGFISILPNVFPILMNFGLMGLLGIRLDSATAMISDIGIGIIVDDTIHFFHTFKEELRASGDYRQSVYRSFSIKGTPTIITSIILIVGFGVVGFSKFMPTFYFGVLTAVLIFNGLWSELLLSPALLMWIKPKFKK